MGLFGSIKNKVDCSISALGTGTDNCKFNIELVNGMYATKRGLTIPADQEFDKAYLQGLIQAGLAIALIDAIGFTDNSTDDTIQETQSGVKIKANLGRYEFSLEYKNGEYFNKALSSLDSFGVYDVILVDEAGSFLMTETTTGLGKGFKTGMFSPDKRKFNDGSVATSKSITFQLLDRAEQDDRIVWIDAEQAGFSPDEVGGVNDISASFVAEPGATDTTIEVDFISAADNQTGLSGLVDENIRVVIGEAVTPVTWVEKPTVPGRYTGTVPALTLDADISVELWDATTDPQVNAIIKGDLVYRSNRLEATVV